MQISKKTLFTIQAICLIVLFFYVPYTFLIWGIVAIPIITLDWWIKWMPVFIQYPYYKFIWKKRVTDIVHSITKDKALFAYPMAIFIELSMDEHFKKGGVKRAEQALKDEFTRLETIFSIYTEHNGRL